MNTRERISIRDLSLTAFFTALTAVLAQIAIPIPFSPVPISFGMVGVYTVAIFLLPKYAVISQICYLLLGAIGLPVFGGFRGGIGTLFGPTGGYLLVYPIIALIVSLAINGSKTLSGKLRKQQLLLKGALSICFAHLVLYLGGTIWLCIITGNTFLSGLTLAVFPYIPMDIVKIVFCVLVILPLRQRFINMGLLKLPVKAYSER